MDVITRRTAGLITHVGQGFSPARAAGPGVRARCCTLVLVPQSTVRHVSVAEAEGLVSAGQTLVLDVRTPGEYEQLGQIPGAWLVARRDR